MSVEQDKKRKTWTVRWRETNPITGETVTRKKRGFQTKKEARRFEDELAQERNAAKFGQIAEGYLASLKGYANNETIAGKRGMLNRYAPALLGKDAEAITRADLQEWRNGLADAPLSVFTKNRVMQIVKAVSKYGADVYGLPDFANGLKAFPRSSDDEKPVRVISPEDFEKIALCARNDLYRRFYVFLFHTGCRRGEALALTKADVNGAEVSFNKSIRRQSVGRKSLKTKASRRTILLDAKAREAIAPLLDTEGDYVFGGGAPLSTSQVQRYFDDALSRAGLPHFRIHDLRHSFISNAILNGADVVTVSRYVGHSDIQQTLNTYSHLLKDSERRLVAMLDRVL